MKEQDRITVYDKDNNSRECSVLAIILNKYIVYTDIDNNNLKHNLYVNKFKKFDMNITLMPLDNIDWIIVEKAYKEMHEQLLNL